MNAFVNAIGQNQGLTRNGAISNTTSGSSILDYFSKSGSYVGRNPAEVAADMGSIFGTDELQALKVVFYNRMITRKCNGFVDPTELQKGQGLRDEFAKSLAWLEVNRPQLLYKNLWLIPEIGRWSDLWYDSASSGYFHYVDQSQVFALIKEGLSNPKHRALLAKFLPQIKSKSKVKTGRHARLTAFARNLCRFLGWSERDYRLFKSSPDNTAHLWQRFASNRQWNQIDFKNIPGKALFKMLANKGRDGKNLVSRNGLDDKYEKFILSSPIAKFTGYPYELYTAARENRNKLQTLTYNAQFDGLLAKVKQDTNSKLLSKKVLCALDTSGSMEATVIGKTQAVDICAGLGIFFSSLIQGHFAGHVIMFDSTSKFLKLSGRFCDKVDQIKSSATAWGSTEYQSVIDAIVRMRQQHPEIPVSDYPDTLLVVSDMQFNRTSSGNTNYEQQMEKLESVGLPNISVIWWNVSGRYNPNDVPSTVSDTGTTLISGFDPSIVNVLLDNEKQVEVVNEETGEVTVETVKLSPLEQMEKALDQEILNALKL